MIASRRSAGKTNSMAFHILNKAFLRFKSGTIILPYYYYTIHYNTMKGLTGLLFLLLIKTVSAQYYYKDIIVTRQTIEKWKDYKKNQVTSVELNSFESNGQPTEGFECRQTIASDFTSIDTYTHSTVSMESNLIAYYDEKGLLKKTIDTSDTYESTTLYEYDPAGRVISIVNTSVETDNHVINSEKHVWKYNESGSPLTMQKIKNETDTTYVQFISDDKGNITEERSVRNNISLPVIFYYYSNENLLTDIVRYNEKAQRLLPDYMFTYDDQKRLASMLFVSEGTSEYQKWIYEYNERGLKSKETCFTKRQELLGRIEYQYKYK